MLLVMSKLKQSKTNYRINIEKPTYLAAVVGGLYFPPKKKKKQKQKAVSEATQIHTHMKR